MGVVHAQERRISGTVTTTSGEPLPGVSVIVSGTTTGTQTNSSGAYSLSVPANAGSLTFSYIGYKSNTISIGAENTINVALELASAELSEIVVTGYSTTSKLKSTISSSVVNADALNNITLPDVNQMLQG